MAEILLSEVEKYYLVMGQDVRVDGRSRSDYRQGDIDLNAVTNSHGSIRARLGETDVIVATKVDLGTPDPDRPDRGTIKFLVDCSPTASPDFEGRGGDELAEKICRILSIAYDKSGTIDLKNLCITPKKYCYVIDVDILVLQCGGNLIDVISMAVKLCLGICELPRVTGLRYDLGQGVPVFSTDEFEFDYLDVKNSPVVVTLPRVGRYFVVDASLEEESCSKGKLAFGVTPDGCVTSIDKLGRGCYQVKSIQAATAMASTVGANVNNTINMRIDSLRELKLRADPKPLSMPMDI
ncbi:Exosome complex component RRP42 [Folsomia candida]|uniref:Ribosomal RNA-processing protein 42 n=1 Tax=Folsomia candida TaxID=158441 RepID=A0A226EIB5_FOLCA|nr:Exosome complex component RRP42 [Folsomia candida]